MAVPVPVPVAVLLAVLCALLAAAVGTPGGWRHVLRAALLPLRASARSRVPVGLSPGRRQHEALTRGLPLFSGAPFAQHVPPWASESDSRARPVNRLTSNTVD